MAKRRWGDRKDAHRVKMTGMAQISIDLKPGRCDSDVYICQKMDVTNLVKYIENSKELGENLKTARINSGFSKLSTLEIVEILNFKSGKWFFNNLNKVGFAIVTISILKFWIRSSTCFKISISLFFSAFAEQGALNK